MAESVNAGIGIYMTIFIDNGEMGCVRKGIGLNGFHVLPDLTMWLA